MTNRRFNEAEVAEIFERASELQHTGSRQIPPSEGMTLSQLQEIGREVGISPESLTLAGLRTVKGDARGLMTGGLAMLGFAVTTGIVVVAQGAFDDTGMIMALTTLATMGAGMFGVSSLRLPGWARLRKEQMEGVLARAAASGDAKQIPDLTRH